jgi:hypothetical protein
MELNKTGIKLKFYISTHSIENEMHSKWKIWLLLFINLFERNNAFVAQTGL